MLEIEMSEKAFSKNGNVAIYFDSSRSDYLSTNTLSYIRALTEIASHVLIISNSSFDHKDIIKLTDAGAIFLERKNIDFDFLGWKEGIEYLEDRIKKSENLILCNSSCFLAFDSLKSLYCKMTPDADIWGISPFGSSKSSSYIQCYFLVVKKKILEDWKYFFSFWEQLPQLRIHESAAKESELRFVQFFRKKGYKSKAIIGSYVLPSMDGTPSLLYPIELFKNGSPFLEKQLFLESYKKILYISAGEISSSALNYVRNNGGRFAEILEDLIKLLPPSQLIQVLHLNYLVGRPVSYKTKPNNSALICFVYFEDMIGYMAEVIRRFIGISEIFIVSPKKEVISRYKLLFQPENSDIHFRLQENRGRNEAGYFLTCKDVWINHRVICALHDKKSAHIKPALLGSEFMRHCEQNLCPSSDSILEAIDLFDKNPLLGLLVPPAPFFGNFIFSLTNPIGRNLSSIKQINNKIFGGKLFYSETDIDAFAAPFGGMFWARSEAFAPLLESSLCVQDFPKEPLISQDGTVLHALERSYPMIVRKAGYYTARLLNVELLPCFYDNLLYFGTRRSYKERFLFFVGELLRRNIFRSPTLYRIAKRLHKFLLQLSSS